MVKAYRTMAEAVEDLKRRGFATNFEYVDRTFRAVDGGKTFLADQLTIVEHHRFEGYSDPNDLSVLYVIEAADGTRGTIADAYGPYADPELNAFLKNVRMQENR